jgi:ankyrin repeat protein/Mg2+ and Co2+ transporter CorA
LKPLQQSFSAAMVRSPSRSSDGGGAARVEPLLLNAIEKKRHSEVIAIIEEAKAKAQPIEHLLRIGLMRAVERENIEITEYLLQSGAKPDSAPGGRVSPVLKAIERKNHRLLQLLLRFGGNVDAQDKQGRTALMIAAWKNEFHIMEILLKGGADVNKKDNNGRHILHNLAADKDCNWGTTVVELLLRQNIALDGLQGQDESKRIPLHWAASTGKRDLCEMLLARTRQPWLQVNAVEGRGKAPIHLAIAHGRDDIVETLLAHGADVMAKSDGSWTPLHNACEQGTVRVVRVLLGAGADVNARLLNGMTPLHVAAQAGHLEVVQCLLEQKDIKRTARDSFGITPFLRAAQNKRRDIVNLLAPSNNVGTLSKNALGACNGFEATIVDFGDFHNENKVTRRTVYEVLYGRDAINPRKPAVTILPRESKATDFRWIHLPANNMAWVEALLTKAFIEEGANDYEGFRALERSFTHQHRGQQIHSHFMRPLCQSTPRTPKNHDESEVSDSGEHGPPQIVVNNGLGLSNDSIAGAQESPLPQFSRPAVRTGTFSTDQTDWTTGSGTPTGKEGKSKQKDKTHKMQKWRGSKQAGGRSGGTETPTKHLDQQPRRKHSTPMTDSGRLRTPGSPGRKDPTSVARGNIFAFMPYLHFETNQRRQEMQKAIADAQKLKERNRRDVLIAPQPPPPASTYDEMLLRAHLTSSHVSLHVRRTLDQFFYHNINTQSRDEDQVVYRYQCNPSHVSHADPKIFMVDQLWMWVLGKDLIVTAFPQRWQQPRNDPLNVLDGIIERLNSKTQEPIRNVYDLATIITERCSGVFDRHRVGDEEYQFLDMFESSIGDATELETKLFKEFNSASAQASAWLQHHRRANRFSRHLEAETRHRDHQNRRRVEHHSHAHALTDPPTKEEHFGYDDGSLAHTPLFVDKLLDIGAETDLLAETKDIRDELNMIAKVLEDQRSVIPDLETAITDIYKEERKAQQDIKRHFRDQLKTIDTHMKDLDRMDKQAKRIYESITDLLDLKQKHANAFEARFARDQAAGTARQSQTIMVFTIVTIVFLPLSFIAALFTINIKEFPHPDDSDEPILPMSYVFKYVFGIGLAISIPFIAIALSFDTIGDFFREVRRRWRDRRGNTAPTHLGGQSTATIRDENMGYEYAINTHALDHALAAGRSSMVQANGRRSIGSYLSNRDEYGNRTLHTATSRGTTDKDALHVTTHGNGMTIVNGRLSAEVRPSPIDRRPTGFRMRGSTDIERGQ